MRYQVKARIQGRGHDEDAVLTNQHKESRGQLVVVIGNTVYDRNEVLYVYGLYEDSRNEVNGIAKRYGFRVIDL